MIRGSTRREGLLAPSAVWSGGDSSQVARSMLRLTRSFTRRRRRCISSAGCSGLRLHVGPPVKDDAVTRTRRSRSSPKNPSRATKNGLNNSWDGAENTGSSAFFFAPSQTQAGNNTFILSTTPKARWHRTVGTHTVSTCPIPKCWVEERVRH